MKKDHIGNWIRSRLFGLGIDVKIIRPWQRAKLLQLPSLRSTDTFMCSYPRSGNTWTRMIIACLLDTSLKKVDLDIIDELVPDAGVLPSAKVPCRVFKQHRPDFNIFPRVIYNVRDGRDAVVSAFAYARQALGFQGDLIDFVVDRQAQIFGFWHEHVNCALAFQNRYPDRILFVRYESIHNDPNVVVAQIAEFLSLKVSAVRIEEIVAVTSFESVKQRNASRTDPRFKYTFREGRVGTWVHSIGELELKIFEGLAAPTLSKLGYPLSCSQPKPIASIVN